MAKKQTFTSKLGKDAKNSKFVKHIKSITSEDSGSIKFIDSMVRLDDNETIDQALKRMEEEASVTLAFGQDLEPEEAITKEAPAEEAQEEAPAEQEAAIEEETKEAPAEEAQEEAPIEEEVSAEEAPESAPEEDSVEKTDESSKE